ncbi:NAD-dependent epimerase/dehydratase family protein [Williamsoniiplasma lucivorax]|uniref:UDP-glucose 4-epimerase n=1 Tax=Williamsoniiplasma lucivorax TaxID=209274 RepID=A0A2S5RD72_9MOLU|nr:NAD-dependent epimerase/dehydratase family protein [Williamsoniiplasma lucivorax]PPE05276.1 UDP-glucose 4-epimerase [Williamsoniiplasma lucivorax]
MKKVLITGANGQVGNEMTARLRKDLGRDNVIATDLKIKEGSANATEGIFEELDVSDAKRFRELAHKYQVDAIIHLASLLSVSSEKDPVFAWQLNTGSIINGLEIAKELKAQFFFPSSVAAYGVDAMPRFNTPQDTFMHPITVYGASKYAGEMLANYYHWKHGVDARSVRFGRLVSYKVRPGQGATDYAVAIYFDAVLKSSYECYLRPDTMLDFTYVDDAIDQVVKFLNTPASQLKHFNGFNLTTFYATPEDIANSIKKIMPDFKITYKLDPVRQEIADSWPQHMDDSWAREEWGLNPKIGLDEMTEIMLTNLKIKLKAEGEIK